LPESSISPASSVGKINSERVDPQVDSSNVDSLYPAYCPPLPLGTKPGDWDYRLALQKCLYGD
jgi:hypothetical protein